jgi:hypothetical protein
MVNHYGAVQGNLAVDIPSPRSDIPDTRSRIAITPRGLQGCCTPRPGDNVILGNEEDPLTIGTGIITINIPMIFHLVDPILLKRDGEYWKKHIQDKIISRINDDYNRNYTNYSDKLIYKVNKLFVNATPHKKKHYIGLTEILPKNDNITWNFRLRKIILKPIKDVQIQPKDNDQLFKHIKVENPNRYLNIVILPAEKVLGVSVFPFQDREPMVPEKIKSGSEYRHALLINTFIFLGSKKPYHKFRTFTHEIGHWCGLLHPFDNATYTSEEINRFGLNKLNFDKSVVACGEIDQDFEGDMIADTYPQKKPTIGTVHDTFKAIKEIKDNHIITKYVRRTPYANIFEDNDEYPNFLNFMDYTDDRQLCMFTNLQMLRMVYMLAKFRPQFIRG